MFRASFDLVGRTPLLMHNDDVEASDMLAEWRKDTANKNMSKPGDDRSPAWTWQTYLYFDEKHIVFPSTNLMVCLRQAGARKILKGNKTYKEITQSGLYIEREFMEFRCGGNQLAIADIRKFREADFTAQCERAKKLGFKLYAKRAKIGQAKHVRVRPRFDSWSIHGELVVTAQEITFPVLEEIFELAQGVGLADWRPGCKTPGAFGMFEAKLKKL